MRVFSCLHVERRTRLVDREPFSAAGEKKGRKEDRKETRKKKEKKTRAGVHQRLCVRPTPRYKYASGSPNISRDIRLPTRYSVSYAYGGLLLSSGIHSVTQIANDLKTIQLTQGNTSTAGRFSCRLAKRISADAYRQGSDQRTPGSGQHLHAGQCTAVRCLCVHV